MDGCVKLFCLSLLLFVGGGLSCGSVQAATTKKIQPLFGTLEFKGTLEKLPKWNGVLRRMRTWKGYFQDKETAALPAKAGWLKLKKEIYGLPLLQQLTRVNRFFNRWPYRQDLTNYGIQDYWATPAEFLQKSGDCEDYAIAKFYAIKELGLADGNMRVVAIRDTIRNIGHAVLVVYVGETVYVLDNQTNMLLPQSKYLHYVPQYSVNEQYRWMHIPRQQKK